MDNLAIEHWTRLDNQRPRPFSLIPSPGVWSLWQSGHRITSWDKQTADQLHYNPKAYGYWNAKYNNLPEMDFAAIKQAYKSTSLYYHLRVSKWLSHLLPVGTRIATWSQDATDACPRCGSPSENHTHVLTCAHPGATSIVEQWIDKLELWLARQHTHPSLRFGIMSILRAGFRNTQWTIPNTTDPEIRRTFQQQHQQGSKNVMFGWWAKGWAETQHTYLRSLSRRTTGQRWLSRLIQKQWEVSWDLWRHRRMEVASKPDSFSISLAHEQANQAIQDAYDRFRHSAYPPLQRWFRQPLPMVTNQHLTFKHDWLLMVNCFSRNLPTET